MPKTPPVTDLEAVTLGCVATQGPCTAYHVRHQFLQAPSARFSGSAGAIYPLLSRLEERGLMASREAATGKRPAYHFTITRSGRAALRSWLKSSLDPSAAFADDPLRTRCLFLDQLTPTDRDEWLETAEHAVREQEQLIADYEERAPDTVWVRLANDNARRLNRARLRWLAQVREALRKEG